MGARPPLASHRFTREEFDRMVASGALAENLRVELLAGDVVDVMVPGPEHVAMTQAVMRWFAPRIDLLRVQQPLAVADDSEPQPDVALVAGEDPHAHPSHALLDVEVAVTQLAEAHFKAALYARASVPEYWIVDVPRAEVIVHSSPAGVSYSEVDHRSGAAVLLPPARLPPLTVAELFANAGL
jgi:Uma2 family endonuclease